MHIYFHASRPLITLRGLLIYLMHAISIAVFLQLPQLKEGKEAESLRGMLLRVSGVVLGAGIMLVIAVFEEELKTLLEA